MLMRISTEQNPDIFASINTHSLTLTHTLTHTHTHTHTQTHAYTQTHAHTQTCMCTHIATHSRISVVYHAHVHMHTHDTGRGTKGKTPASMTRGFVSRFLSLVCMYACMHACVGMCVSKSYIYTYHIYTHRRTNIFMCLQVCVYTHTSHIYTLQKKCIHLPTPARAEYWEGERLQKAFSPCITCTADDQKPPVYKYMCVLCVVCVCTQPPHKLR